MTCLRHLLNLFHDNKEGLTEAPNTPLCRLASVLSTLISAICKWSLIWSKKRKIICYFLLKRKTVSFTAGSDRQPQLWYVPVPSAISDSRTHCFSDAISVRFQTMNIFHIHSVPQFFVFRFGKKMSLYPRGFT